MSAIASVADTVPQEQVDLAALGSRWAPPQGLDATPEVSEVLTGLPWWAARGLLYLIVSFVAIALLWAHLSQVDVVAVARGALVPEGRVRPVQAAAGGVVQAVRVREGSGVSRGQMIMQLEAKELRARIGRLREELATSEEQFRQLAATRGPGAETLERQNRVTQLKSEIAGVELALAQATITAPSAGVITKLSVKGPGAVVQPGEQIAAIAPAGARLLVEAQMPNKDMAFTTTGRAAKLKLDAFPFQDYGSVRGTVIAVAPDAEVDERLGSFYKVTIAPEQTSVIARGQTVPLRPGLALTAEIVTERKSVLALILDPIRKLKAEAEGVK